VPIIALGLIVASNQLPPRSLCAEPLLLPAPGVAIPLRSWRPWLTRIAKPHSPPARTARHRPPRYGAATRWAPCSATPAACS
jgi:hypothetical protein